MEDKDKLIKEAVTHIERSISILDDIIKQSDMNVKLIRSWLDRNPDINGR